MTSLKHAASKNFVPIGSVLALCGAVALTGCSASANGENPTSAASNGSSNASASSSGVASGAASASPQEATPTSPAKNIPEPVMPKEAKEHSAKGLEAFTRYWFKVHNYAQKTGDTKQMMALCIEDSAFCEERKKSIDQFSDRKAWMTGGDAHIGTFYTQMNKTPGGYIHALVELDQRARTVYQSHGQVPEADRPASKDHFESYSYWDNGSWKYLGIKTIAGVEYKK